MMDLTSLIDMARFQHAQDQGVNVGPSMSQMAGANPLEDLQGNMGPATSLDLPQELPAAQDVNAPMLGSAEANLQGQAEPAEKSGIPWIDLLRLGSVGLTDIANVVGNPRAPVGGAIYEQNKEYFRTKQMDMLKKRHNMFDDAMKQSTGLPTEVLTDPRFAGLSEAKAALEKDAADGNIDNEKNVSKFLTEMARAKKDLEELGIQTETRRKIEQDEALAKAGAERQRNRIAELEQIVANPQGVDPYQLAAAKRELQAIQDAEPVEGEIDGQKYRLPASEWAKIRAREAENKSDYDRQLELEKMRQAGATQRERMGNEAQLSSTQGAYDRREALDAIQGVGENFANTDRRVAMAAKAAEQAGKPMTPEQIEKLRSGDIYEQGDAIIRAAQKANLDLERQGNVWRLGDKTYDMYDAKQWLALLEKLGRTLPAGMGTGIRKR